MMTNQNSELLNIHQHKLVKSLNESTRFFILQLEQSEINNLPAYDDEEDVSVKGRHIVRYACHQ